MIKQNADITIEAKGLVKRYSEEVLAVDGVDLSIQANTIYALLACPQKGYHFLS